MMIQKFIYLLIGLFAFCIAVGCDGENEGVNSDADADADTDTDTDADTDSDTDSDTDTDSDADSDTDSDTPVDNEWGLAITLPVSHEVECEDWEGQLQPWTTDDADWLCTFSYGSTQGIVYLQNQPTGCEMLMSQQALYTTTASQIWIDGDVYPLSGGSYDWGGNHQNDMLSFEYDGLQFSFYHSSFGFGWRACQNMDCLQVYDASGALLEDGCTCERSLPATCVRIQSDGTFDGLEDTFSICDGDATCG